MDRSLALRLQAQSIGHATQAALGGWQGQAQAAFADYATHASSALDSNADAFAKAAGALDQLAEDLSRAQRATRQAASDCETYQQQLTTALQEADQHTRDAQNLSQQAAAATHPHAQARLNHQAQAASDQAQAAQGQADRARDQLEAAQKQGRDADRAYQHSAETITAQIQAASDDIHLIPRLHGGAPIPIDITPADLNLAKSMLRGAGNLANAARAATNPALLRRLARGSLTPAAAAAFLRSLQTAEQNAAKPQEGSIIDGLGGLVNGLSLGAVSFGNPDTARYRGGEDAAMIPVDPEALVTDADRLAARAAEDTAKDDTVAASRAFDSADPLVGDLANSIEERLPGKVRGVNVPAYDADGVLRTDYDIQLNDSVIQVKSGRGTGIGAQITRTQRTTGDQVIVYGPRLGPFAQEEAKSRGAVVFTSLDALLSYLAGGG